MRTLIASEKFQNSTAELPIALGKTISNETYVFDMAKMPHLLMAGATGQGKSVGLNAMLVSMLYRRHPSQLKFVLVDPKKVELTLYNKIIRHYLAQLPDSEDAIITDTSKVVSTLNSLCVEMDHRYELLKHAQCRNIKEYNAKFTKRKIMPGQAEHPDNGKDLHRLGHHYMPYIVLVVDEFADLIMTAGKEVETPIARLAQLARAIGIHLIIATQRPSVNIITGTIKAEAVFCWPAWPAIGAATPTPEGAPTRRKLELQAARGLDRTTRCSSKELVARDVSQREAVLAQLEGHAECR